MYAKHNLLQCFMKIKWSLRLSRMLRVFASLISRVADTHQTHQRISIYHPLGRIYRMATYFESVTDFGYRLFTCRYSRWWLVVRCDALKKITMQLLHFVFFLFVTALKMMMYTIYSIDQIKQILLEIAYWDLHNHGLMRYKFCHFSSPSFDVFSFYIPINQTNATNIGMRILQTISAPPQTIRNNDKTVALVSQVQIAATNKNKTGKYTHKNTRPHILTQNTIYLAIVCV